MIGRILRHKRNGLRLQHAIRMANLEREITQVHRRRALNSNTAKPDELPKERLMNATLKPAAAWPFPTTSAKSADAETAPVAVTAVHKWVPVPGRTITVDGVDIVVADFRVGKYMTRFNADGTATIDADAVPSVRNSFNDLGPMLVTAGLKMLTLSQSAVLAIDIAEQAANWSGGAVGKGDLLQGLHLGTVNGAVDGNYVYEHESERRGFVLSNGEIVDDAAGHLLTYLFDDVHGDERGLVKTKSFPADSPVVSGAPAPSMEQGVGWYPDAGEDWSGDALLRGGGWRDGGYAGVFGLVGVSPVGRYDSVGVRCTPAE